MHLLQFSKVNVKMGQKSGKLLITAQKKRIIGKKIFNRLKLLAYAFEIRELDKKKGEMKKMHKVHGSMISGNTSKLYMYINLSHTKSTIKYY